MLQSHAVAIHNRASVADGYELNHTLVLSEVALVALERRIRRGKVIS